MRTRLYMGVEILNQLPTLFLTPFGGRGAVSVHEEDFTRNGDTSSSIKNNWQYFHIWPHLIPNVPSP